MSGYTVTRLHDVHRPDYRKDPGEADWYAIRMHLGIRSFGTNAYVQPEAGNPIVNEHTETDTRHEELYFVARGHATFTVDGEEVDAPEGTLVYVPDPASPRSAVAHVDGTTVLCFGGAPGEAFAVSAWEAKYDPAAAR